VQVVRDEDTIAISEAGKDMTGTAFTPDSVRFAQAVPGAHFQTSLPESKHAGASGVRPS
jgi:hypothetical protein